MAEIRTMTDLMRAILTITRGVWKIQGQGILVCKKKGLYKVGDEETITTTNSDIIKTKRKTKKQNLSNNTQTTPNSVFVGHL